MPIRRYYVLETTHRGRPKRERFDGLSMASMTYHIAKEAGESPRLFLVVETEVKPGPGPGPRMRPHPSEPDLQIDPSVSQAQAQMRPARRARPLRVMGLVVRRRRAPAQPPEPRCEVCGEPEFPHPPHGEEASP